MTTNLINNIFSDIGENSLISKLKDIFNQSSDSSAFDEILNNKEDVLLFDKTIDNLKKTNKQSETIKLSTGKEITVSVK